MPCLSEKDIIRFVGTTVAERGKRYGRSGASGNGVLGGRDRRLHPGQALSPWKARCGSSGRGRVTGGLLRDARSAGAPVRSGGRPVCSTARARRSRFPVYTGAGCSHPGGGRHLLSSSRRGTRPARREEAGQHFPEGPGRPLGSARCPIAAGLGDPVGDDHGDFLSHRPGEFCLPGQPKDPGTNREQAPLRAHPGRGHVGHARTAQRTDRKQVAPRPVLSARRPEVCIGRTPGPAGPSRPRGAQA